MRRRPSPPATPPSRPPTGGPRALKHELTIAARTLTAGLLLLVSSKAAPAAAAPPPLTPGAFQALLQRFVNKEYLKGFRHLGDERDFDHGHLLFDDRSKLIAILYHTQELGGDHRPGSPYGYIDPAGRNWIQWVSDGRVENAARYQRKTYPKTPSWDCFRVLDLPALRARHTVLPKMLDPGLGVDAAKTAQWVFTRTSCSSHAAGLRVFLPNKDKQRICLTLSDD